MSHQHDIGRGVRLLAVAIAALQLTGTAAVAQARLDDPPHAEETEVRSLAAGDAVAHDATEPLPDVAPAPVPQAAAPAPPPPPPPPPAPAPAPSPPPPPPPPAPAVRQDPAARVLRAFEGSVPASWRAAIPVRFRLIGGNTSWAAPDGTIQVSEFHASASDALLRAVVTHEFGHLIAFRYGSQRYNGAGPEGWPAYGDRPEEAWADCVSQVMTGVVEPSHGLPPCSGSSLSWTSSWISAGPGAHARTG